MSQPPPVYGVPPGYPGYPPLVHPHRYPPHRTQADEDYDDKVIHRLIKITDRTLDVVFSRFRGFSFTITLSQKPKGVPRR